MRTPAGAAGRAPPSPARVLDPDRLESPASQDGERALFSRHVLSVQDGRRAAAAATSSAPPLSFTKANGSPRAAVPLVPLRDGGGPAAGDAKARSSPRNAHVIIRPPSPVGAVPADSVVTMALIGSPRLPLLRYKPPPRRAILHATDVEKITSWLSSLARESRQYASYALYCDMLFRESSVLTRGKPVPNRLQTAIAFHCLCRATSVFSRHEEILHRICRDLGAAIYLNHDDKLIDEREIDALDFFTRLTSYYDHYSMLQQQKEDLQHEMLRQKQEYQERIESERARNEQLRDLEKRLQIKGLDKITHRNTLAEDLRGKLSGVLQKFHFIDDIDKQEVILGVISALKATLSAETLLVITDEMNPFEKDKLLRGLFQDEISSLTHKIESQVAISSSAQQNVILERSATRITRFQSLITMALKGQQGKDGPSIPMVGVDDDLSDQDRKVLEAVDDAMDELERTRATVAELTAKLNEAEQLANSLRIKNNDIVKEATDTRVLLEQQIEELKRQLELANPPREEKEVQTDGNARVDGAGGEGDEGDDEFGSASTSSESGSAKGRRRRGLQSVNEDDDGLICKNRPKNKFGFGIASIIDQAKIPSSTIRKILMKRKPLTISELHSIIVGYYQAKMYQDAQDDLSGKPRANLAQFIMEMYVLHYGLKDLAISQLVFLDAAIRKNARESARVRIFGLLTGSLDPESHACSVQGIDFFLLLVVILFNAGVYKKGRKQAEAIAKNLKESFGDGIFMSPKSLTVKYELVCQVIDLAFSYITDASSGSSTLELLKEDIRSTCATMATTVASATAPASAGGGNSSALAAAVAAATTSLDIDLVLEKIMNYWFVLYEQQIQDIHAMFVLVDANGDGTLDFNEFCDVVNVLEPDMDRRDALALYNRAAGDDHVIDKDEFVQLMLAHQRGVILRELYNRESTAKKMSMAVLSSAQQQQQQQQQRKSMPPQSKAMTVAQMDKDGSYASLAAAMIGVVPPARSIESTSTESVEREPVEGQDATSCEEGESDDVLPVQDNISFQTLSRLSVWATEAKGKLQSLRIPMPSPVKAKKSVLLDIAERDLSEEVDAGGFKEDVDELLRRALSKANIDLEELF